MAAYAATSKAVGETDRPVGDPDLLILDEPSSGLDPHGIRTFQEVIREEAADGTTVFFSSHVLGQVAAVCDRGAILDDGELVTVDTIEGLRERSGVGSSLVVDAPTPRLDPGTIADIDGVTDDDRLRITYADPAAKALAIHRLVESGVSVLDFEVEEATLEDLFAAFTRTDGESVRNRAEATTEAERTRTPAVDGGTVDGTAASGAAESDAEVGR